MTFLAIYFEVNFGVWLWNFTNYTRVCFTSYSTHAWLTINSFLACDHLAHTFLWLAFAHLMFAWLALSTCTARSYFIVGLCLLVLNWCSPPKIGFCSSPHAFLHLVWCLPNAYPVFTSRLTGLMLIMNQSHMLTLYLSHALTSFSSYSFVCLFVFPNQIFKCNLNCNELPSKHRPNN